MLPGQWIGLRWAALLALSAAFALIFAAMRLPAALLLGPMAAGIVIAFAGWELRVPHRPFVVAQSVIGCMIARSIPPAVISEILRDWPLFLAAVFAVIAVTSAMGWLLTRWRVLPGTTAVWGSSPGAAAAMILMAGAYGADIRLVAFMQYLRVFLVSVVATVVSGLWAPGGSAPVATTWFPPLAIGPFAATMALVALGALPVLQRHVPAGALLVPLGGGLALQDAGWLTIELPPWLLASCYALLGWSVGLRFTRSILLHAAQALPRVTAAILVLIGACGGLAAVLVAVAGVDPLTAYLAMSPGGADSAAIIAASSNVDVPFVMAMQTTRLIIVIAIGPSLAGFIARRAGGGKRQT